MNYPFPFIRETWCSYQKSESHDQNDEINNPLSLSRTIYEGHVKKYQTLVRQIVNILP